MTPLDLLAILLVFLLGAEERFVRDGSQEALRALADIHDTRWALSVGAASEDGERKVRSRRLRDLYCVLAAPAPLAPSSSPCFPRIEFMAPDAYDAAYDAFLDAEGVRVNPWMPRPVEHHAAYEDDVKRREAGRIWAEKLVEKGRGRLEVSRLLRDSLRKERRAGFIPVEKP